LGKVRGKERGLGKERGTEKERGKERGMEMGCWCCCKQRLQASRTGWLLD